MAHVTSRSSYDALLGRLNRFPQGAVTSERLFAILRVLMSEREAGLLALVPIRPFDAATAAQAWKMDEAGARRVLDELAGRAVLLDVEREDGRREYVLPPPMAGFFEFSMMRVRDDLDQGLLSELFYQYITVEDEFIRALFTRGETQLGRVFVHEPALPERPKLEVLDWERASQVVSTASCRAVGLCYCRHKMMHLGTACDGPLDICMTFGTTAASLVRHGHAREVEIAEGLDLLAHARELGLVQFGENVRREVAFICNCCGCCCEALIAARRFAHLHPVHTTAFLPRTAPEVCAGCGKCVSACPVEAMVLVSANDPRRSKRKLAQLDRDRCLGCGVCVPACPERALTLEHRGERVLTPVDTVHRTVVMALERGTMQHLLFDQGAMASHRAMAAILGAILRLGPVRRELARRALRSRYLEHLLARRWW